MPQVELLELGYKREHLKRNRGFRPETIGVQGFLPINYRVFRDLYGFIGFYTDLKGFMASSIVASWVSCPDSLEGIVLFELRDRQEFSRPASGYRFSEGFV